MDKILYNIWHVKNRLLPANPDANPPIAAGLETLTTGTIFQKHNTKFYVSIATLSVNNSIKFLDHLKQGFKRMISWNKYRSSLWFHSKDEAANFNTNIADGNNFQLFSYKAKVKKHSGGWSKWNLKKHNNCRTIIASK